MNPVRAGMVKHPKDYPFHNFHAYAYGKHVYSGLFVYHPAYLALGDTPEARRHAFNRLIEIAVKGWVQRRWQGISGSHGVGRNKRKNAYEDFLELAKGWFFVLRARGDPAVDGLYKKALPN